MAYYQFSLPMTTSESYQIIKTVCERSCTIKQDCPNESIEVRTRFRMGKGSLTFVFYLRESDTSVQINLICTDGKSYDTTVKKFNEMLKMLDYKIVAVPRKTRLPEGGFEVE